MAIGYVWAIVTDSLEWNEKKECTKRIFDRSSIGVSFCFTRILALILFCCSVELGGLVAEFNSFGY